MTIGCRKVTREQIETLAMFLGINESDKFTLKQAYKDFAHIKRRNIEQ